MGDGLLTDQLEEKLLGKGTLRDEEASPCRYLAVVHVGRDDDPELALATLRTETGRESCWGLSVRAPQPCKPQVPAHLAVQHDHVLWVSAEPGLHGFADGAQLVQRGRMQFRPAEVLDLGQTGVQGWNWGQGPEWREVGGKGTGYRGLGRKVSLSAVHNSLHPFLTCTMCGYLLHRLGASQVHVIWESAEADARQLLLLITRRLGASGVLMALIPSYLGV